MQLVKFTDRRIFFLAVNFLDNRAGKVNECRVVSQQRERKRKGAREGEKRNFLARGILHTRARMYPLADSKNVCLTLWT